MRSSSNTKTFGGHVKITTTPTASQPVKKPTQKQESKPIVILNSKSTYNQNQQSTKTTSSQRNKQLNIDHILSTILKPTPELIKKIESPQISSCTRVNLIKIVERIEEINIICEYAINSKIINTNALNLKDRNLMNLVKMTNDRILMLSAIQSVSLSPIQQRDFTPAGLQSYYKFINLKQQQRYRNIQKKQKIQQLQNKQQKMEEHLKVQLKKIQDRKYEYLNDKFRQFYPSVHELLKNFNEKLKKQRKSQQLFEQLSKDYIQIKKRKERSVQYYLNIELEKLSLRQIYQFIKGNWQPQSGSNSRTSTNDMKMKEQQNKYQDVLRQKLRQQEQLRRIKTEHLQIQANYQKQIRNLEQLSNNRQNQLTTMKQEIYKLKAEKEKLKNENTNKANQNDRFSAMKETSMRNSYQLKKQKESNVKLTAQLNEFKLKNSELLRQQINQSYQAEKDRKELQLLRNIQGDFDKLLSDHKKCKNTLAQKQKQMSQLSNSVEHLNLIKETLTNQIQIQKKNSELKEIVIGTQLERSEGLQKQLTKIQSTLGKYIQQFELRNLHINQLEQINKTQSDQIKRLQFDCEALKKQQNLQKSVNASNLRHQLKESQAQQERLKQTKQFEQDNKKLKEHYDKKIKEMQYQIYSTQTTKRSLESQINLLEKKVNRNAQDYSVSSNFEQLQKKYNDLNQTITTLTSENNNLKENLQKQKNQLQLLEQRFYSLNLENKNLKVQISISTENRQIQRKDFQSKQKLQSDINLLKQKDNKNEVIISTQKQLRLLAQSKLSQENFKYNQTLQQKMTELSASSQNRKRLEKQINQLKREKQIIQMINTDLEQKQRQVQRQLNSSKQEQQLLQRKLSQQTKENECLLDQIKQLEAKQSELSSLRYSMQKQLAQKLQYQNKNQSTLNARIKQLEDQKTNIEFNLAQQSNKTRSFEVTKKQLEDKIASMDNKLKILEDENKRLQSARSYSKVQSPLKTKENEKIVQEHRALQIEHLSQIQLNSKLKDQIQKLQMEKLDHEEELMSKNKLIDGLKSKLVQYQRDKSNTDKQIKAISEERQKFQKKIKSKNEEIEDMQSQLNKLNEMMEDMNEYRGAQNQDKQANQFKEVQHKALVDDLNAKINQLSKDILAKNAQFEAKIQEVIEKNIIIKSKEEQINKLKAQMVKLKEEMQLLIKEKESLKKQREMMLKEDKEIVKKSVIKVEMAQNDNDFDRKCLFQGEILQDELRHKKFLAETVENNKRMKILKTRLIFKYDPLNKINFHKYIDGVENLILIVKTFNEKFIAAYSEGAFKPKKLSDKDGLIISLSNSKVFNLVEKNKKAITYDDYYVIFGNSQIRLKALENKIFSNFGIGNSYYGAKGEKVSVLLGLGPQDREIEIKGYEFYEAIFEN